MASIRGKRRRVRTRVRDSQPTRNLLIVVSPHRVQLRLPDAEWVRGRVYVHSDGRIILGRRETRRRAELGFGGTSGQAFSWGRRRGVTVLVAEDAAARRHVFGAALEQVSAVQKHPTQMDAERSARRAISGE